MKTKENLIFLTKVILILVAAIDRCSANPWPQTSLPSSTAASTKTTEPVQHQQQQQSRTPSEQLEFDSNTPISSSSISTLKKPAVSSSSSTQSTTTEELTITYKPPVASEIIRRGSELLCGEANPSGKGNKRLILDRHIGGRETEPGGFPYHARLFVRKSYHGYSWLAFRCSGVILDEHHILTTANCVTSCRKSIPFVYKNTEVSVTIGDHSIRSNDGEIEVDISQIIVHKNYTSCEEGTLVNDIALIRTATPIEYKFTSDGYGSINRLCMPNNRSVIYSEGESVIVSSWGVIDWQRNSHSLDHWFLLRSASDILRYNQKSLVNCPACLKKYSPFLTEDHIFTINSNRSGISCIQMGDPLVRVVDNRYELVGLSIGMMNDTVTMYTRVADYVDWIKKNSNLQCLSKQSGRYTSEHVVISSSTTLSNSYQPTISSSSLLSSSLQSNNTGQSQVASKIIRRDSELFCGEANPSGKGNEKLILDKTVGRKAKPGEFPFHVKLDISSSESIEYFSNFACGGVILDKYHILTAASCVTTCGERSVRSVLRTTDVSIIIGSHSICSNNSEIRVKASQIIPHENFTLHCSDNIPTVDNIALIKIATPIEYKFTSDGYGSINRLCMPNDSSVVHDVDNSVTVPIYLNRASVIRDLDCTDDLTRSENTWCSHSGEPLLRIVDNRHELVGIASFAGCDDGKKPDSRYTKVADYISWIEANSKGLSQPQSTSFEISSATVSTSDHTPEQPTASFSSPSPLQNIATKQPPVASKIIRRGSELLCGEANPSGKSDKSLISDGFVIQRKAEPGEFPHQVRLDIRFNFLAQFCGGVILDEHHILTAATCATASSGNMGHSILRPADVSVTIGDHSISSSDGEIKVNVSQIIVHENFSYQLGYKTTTNNIAILKTATPIKYKFTDNGYGSINRPCMPNDSSVVYNEGESVIVSSWGTTEISFLWPAFNGYTTDILGCIQNPITNIPYSKDHKMNIEIFDDNILIPSSNQSNVCEAYLGDPLVRIVDNKYELVGIRIWNFGCIEPTADIVYTRVASHVDWIKRVTEGEC